MWSKVILCVATLCVVNASVITVNVFDEHVDSVEQDDAAASDCNWQACDQLCRRLGFPSGVCVNGRCKCDNFRNGDDELQIPAASESSEDTVSVRRCSPQECHQRCRRLKFPGGACVNGRCKCDNFRAAQDFASLIEEYLALSNCNPQECNQRCRRLKFPGGACVNGRCKCDNFRTANDIDATEDKIEQSDLSLNEDENLEAFITNADGVTLSSCSPQECDQRCRRLKFPGGVCVNGRCKCDNFRTADDDLQIPAASESSEDTVSVRRCSPQECHQRCRRLKFPGGACVNGRCKCDNFRAAEGFASVIEEYLALSNCNPQECNQRCRRLKFPGGACVNGKCKCDNFRTANDIDATEDEVVQSDLSLNEEENLEAFIANADGVTLSRCSPQECDQRCRRLKFPGGVCVNGRCKCDNFRTADDMIHALGCNSRVCNERCQQLGNAGGVCINSHCTCRKIKYTTDPELELEEASSPRSCDYRDCQQRCRKIGFSGACVRGRCQCFSRSAELSTVELEMAAPRRRVCDLKACHKWCEKIGMKGVCNDNLGVCRCLRTSVTELTVDDASTNEVEESNQIVNQDQNVEEHHQREVRAYCSEKECSFVCTLTGYYWGECKNNKCKCTGDGDGDGVEYKADEVCNMWACNEWCRVRGFRGGMCLDNVCKCNNLP